MFHMIIEQTKEYKMRMKYYPKENRFIESNVESLAYNRGFIYPYGWIKETGAPPNPHWDVLLMSDRHFELGDELEVKIVGVFIRSDGDHKMIAVEKNSEINEYEELTNKEREQLHQLYPRINKEIGEGWFGSKRAKEVIENSEKPL